MIVKVHRSELDAKLIEHSMQVCFGSALSGDDYRFDYMYIAYGKDEEPEAFTMVQEMTKDHAWLSFGGTVKGARGYKTLKNFHEMIQDLGQTYKYVSAQVWQENFAMLKIYLAYKFLINGVRRSPEGKMFVELFKEMGA